MLVEEARYQGLDLRFCPPIDTGRQRPNSFAQLITMAIMGPRTAPEILAEEEQTAAAALDQVETTIQILEGMGGLDDELGDDLRRNVVMAFLEGKFAVAGVRAVEAEDTATASRQAAA